MRHTTLSTVKPEPGESREAVLAHPHIVEARQAGWECDHDPDSRGGVVNRPDWEFLWPLDAGPCPTPHRHCYVELKAGSRQLTDGQRRRLANLRAAGEVAEEVRIDTPFGVAQLRLLLGLRAQEAATRPSGMQQCFAGSAGPLATSGPAGEQLEDARTRRIAELKAEHHGQAAAERIADAELRDRSRRSAGEAVPA